MYQTDGAGLHKVTVEKTLLELNNNGELNGKSDLYIGHRILEKIATTKPSQNSIGLEYLRTLLVKNNIPYKTKCSGKSIIEYVPTPKTVGGYPSGLNSQNLKKRNKIIQTH